MFGLSFSNSHIPNNKMGALPLEYQLAPICADDTFEMYY